MKILITLLMLANLNVAHAHEVKIGGDIAFDFKELEIDIYAAIAPAPQEPAVSNAGVIVVNEGVLIIDSHMTPAAGKALIETIAKATDKKPRWFIQTHFHGDHVGGSAAFPSGMDVIAHHRTRETLLKRIVQKSEKIPNIAIRDDIVFFRNREIHIKYSGRGHTNGDVYVWLPGDKILFAGDLFFNGHIGFMKDAYIQEWIKTLDEMIALNPSVVVPGHGPVSDLDGLKGYQTFLKDFLKEVSKLKKKGLSAEETVEKFELGRPYRTWGMQDKALKANILRVYEQVD